ncbi:MAG TPA: alpha-1,2-fucosyltransferase [Candidatus Paceibacterota bacterium]|jgi:hypothetical protein|nr:alpha-1,2-fucosyltransferase [Candidatus Paceibacterota bacterium]
MIIVKLSGGLGNQLFQYAFARAVSKKLNTDFKLDATPFETYYKLHKYALNHFNLTEKLAKRSDMFGFVWIRERHKFFDTFYRYLRLKSKLMPFYYPEQRFDFDPNVFKKDNMYFDGFWQTEKYFKNIENELKEEMTLKKPLSPYSQSVLDQIQKTNAVCLHIRRGDYVTNASTNAVHGTCSLEYYERAIKYISEKVDSPHFFIFSDDYPWAVENFKNRPYPVTCISNGADKNYEDLTLMSHCKHFIIANSSFSWWGAWLSRNTDKIVIGPKEWFKSKKTTVSTDDVIPSSWIKM